MQPAIENDVVEDWHVCKRGLVGPVPVAQRKLPLVVWSTSPPLISRYLTTGINRAYIPVFRVEVRK
jgi:hypothetical protein